MGKGYFEVEYFIEGRAQPIKCTNHQNNNRGFSEGVQEIRKMCTFRSVTQLVIVMKEGEADAVYRIKHFLASDKTLKGYSPRIYSSPDVDAHNVSDCKHHEVDFLQLDVQKVSHYRCNLIKDLANAKRELVKDLYLSLDTDNEGSLPSELELYDEQVALWSIPDLLPWLSCNSSCKDKMLKIFQEHPELSVDSGLYTKNQRIDALETMIQVMDQTLSKMSGIVRSNLVPFLPPHLAVGVSLEIGDIYRYRKSADLLKLAGLVYDDAARDQVNLQSYILQSTLYCVSYHDEFRKVYLGKIQASRMSPKTALRMVSRKFIRVAFKVLLTNENVKTKGTSFG